MNIQIVTNLKVETLYDLPKLRKVMEATKMKPNYTKIGKELDKDPRTVKRYYEGNIPNKKTRNRKSTLDNIQDEIKWLLSNDTKNIFVYKRNLYEYLVENKLIVGIAESTFRNYLLKRPELNKLFKEQGIIYNEYNSNNGITRNEQPPGKQAQLDWKENLTMELKDGTKIQFNIGVLLLSHSRFRYSFISLDRKQDVLFDFLTKSFESLGGVPCEIINDNMKTVMDKSRTKVSRGIINEKANTFAKDFGFEFKPCHSYDPKSKGKVEELTNNANSNINQGTNNIPLLILDKEIDYLKPLPRKSILAENKIEYHSALVNKSGMISYKQNLYSVPTKYIDQYVQYRIIKNMIHILAKQYDDNWNKTKEYENILETTNFESQIKGNIKELGEYYG